MQADTLVSTVDATCADAAALLRSQHAEIERLRADAWVACSDRLPPAGELVIASSDGALSVMSRDDGDDDGWCWVQQKWAWNLGDPEGLELDDDYQPTHWRPLPAPPADTARADEGGAK